MFDAFLRTLLPAFVGGLIVLSVAAEVRAQDGSWRAHTSMREVVGLSVSETDIWAATTGGVFRYGITDGTLERFTAAEGLHNVQTRSVVYDARRGVVWIGYRDGVIDRLDPATGAVRAFFDIARNDRFPSSGGKLNRLRLRGDSLLVATSFGLVVFDAERAEVRATYSQFGALPAATPVRDVIVAPLPGGTGPGFWVATEEGLAYASLSADNLQDPSVWVVERDGLPSRDLLSLAVFRDAIYVGTAAGVARRERASVYTEYAITSQPVSDLLALSDRVLAVDDFKLYGLFASGGAGGAGLLADGFFDLTAIAQGPTGDIWVGDRFEGLNRFEEPAAGRPSLLEGSIFPDGPYDGLFADLTVDAEGNLWAGAAEDIIGSGFYRLDPSGQWTTFSGRFFPELQGRSNFRRIHADAQGNLWAASRGGGLAQVTPSGEVVLYEASNSSLQPEDTRTPGFIPLTGVASEQDGTLWVTNRAAPRPLSVRTPNGEWTALRTPACPGLSSSAPLGPIFVDAFGQKWIIVIERGNFLRTIGLIVLDTADTPTDPSDDACRYFNTIGSQGQGLPDLEISSITEDRGERIWVGTKDGPAFFFTSILAARDNSNIPVWPLLADRSEANYALNGLDINDIAIDPANRVWFATNEGAFLFEEVEGGFQEVEHFTAENSPLFSNVIVSVTVDPATGRVYFATDQGLVSVLGGAVAASPEVRDLFVFPNPVRLGGGTAEIVIDGLVEATRVQVVAPHGEVVARFDARGGRARWDGLDFNRRAVPSGVYLIVAVGENGEGTAYGKVAVID